MSKAVNVSLDLGNLTTISMSNENIFTMESRIKEFETGIDDFNINEKLFSYVLSVYLFFFHTILV